MRYREIGKTGVKISEIGFGCWTMGGPNWSLQNGAPIGWGDVTEADILAGIKAGLDAGVNHWDNADIYGNGRAERTLGTCLAKLGAKRETQVIATKVGHFRGTAPYAYTPEHIRNQCEQSLRNLRTDYLDIYYFHHGTYTGPDVTGKDHDYLAEAAASMHALVKAGKVRAVGQSAYSNEDFARAIPVLKPDILQNKANMRYADFIKPGCELQKLMATHGCTFVGFGPLDQGILLDKFDPENPPKFEEGDYRNSRKDFAPAAMRTIKDKLTKIKSRFGNTTEDLASTACRWVLAHDHVASVIPGFRNERQAKCNLRAATDAPLNAAEVKYISDIFAT